MRIAVVGPTYPFRGGIALHTTLMVQALRERHEVLFLSFTRQYPRWLFPGRDDRDPTPNPLTTPTHYTLDSLNPHTWWQTARQIKQWQADLIILPWWHIYWTPAWSALVRLLRPLPCLFMCHNIRPHEQRRTDTLALRLVLGQGKGFIVHAQTEADHLQTYLPDINVRVTPHPTYAPIGQNPAPAADLPFLPPPDVPLLVMAGFIRPYKGLAVLLAALPLVLDQQLVHLVVAGEIWGDPAGYQTQIAQLNLTNHVTLINQYLPNDTLTTLIQRANAIVLPYRTATQSGVIQLAFGHGTPVITTNVGGLGEAVTHLQTGLVVPPNDPTKLAHALNRYFAEAHEAPFRHNIQAQQAQFSWQTLVACIEELAHLVRSS